MPTLQQAPRLHAFHESLQTEASFSEYIVRAFDTPLATQRDVSKDPQFQALGVDFIYAGGGAETWVDDKADTFLTSNACLELISKNCWGQLKPGWMFSSHMGWLRYNFVKSGDCFLFDMAELRANLLPRLERFGTVSAVNKGRGSQGVRHITFSALVPIATAMAASPSSMHVSLADELRVAFPSHSMLPVQHAHRTVSAADAMAKMLGHSNRTAPLSADLRALWSHGMRFDRMKRNADAVAAMDAIAVRS